MTPDELMRQAHLKDDVERLQLELATAHDCWRSDVAEMRAELAALRDAKATSLANMGDRIAVLEAVLTAARRYVDGIYADATLEVLEDAVRAADAPPPTGRAESDADDPNPRTQGQNP